MGKLHSKATLESGFPVCIGEVFLMVLFLTRNIHSNSAMMTRSVRFFSPSYKATSCFILLLMMALKPYSAAEVDQTNNQIEGIILYVRKYTIIH